MLKVCQHTLFQSKEESFGFNKKNLHLQFKWEKRNDFSWAIKEKWFWLNESKLSETNEYFGSVMQGLERTH